MKPRYSNRGQVRGQGYPLKSAAIHKLPETRPRRAGGYYGPKARAWDQNQTDKEMELDLNGLALENGATLFI